LRENTSKKQQTTLPATTQRDQLSSPFFFSNFALAVDQDTASTCSPFKNNCWGAGSKSQTNSPKEQLRKPSQNFKFQIFLFVAPGSLFGGLILLEIGDSEHSPLGFYHCRPPNLQ
jgi:hypothetical protein